MFEINLRFGFNVSLTLTPVALLGPLFVTVMTNSIKSPTLTCPDVILDVLLILKSTIGKAVRLVILASLLDLFVSFSREVTTTTLEILPEDITSATIVKVADEYLEKINSDSIEFKEINILMGNILPKDSDHLMGYNLNTTIMSHQQMIFNYQLIDSITDAKLKQELGLGFNIIKDEYDGNTLILDFFAQKYLLEIFKESSDFSLEKLLHHNFTNFELLKEYGINNFLINYIRHKDIALANYLRTKNHLLNDLKKNVLLYGSNWLNFEKRNAHLKVELIIEQVSQIMDVNREEYHFDVMDIIYYTARKLGLEDKFREYEQSAFEDYDDYDFNQFMEECINFVDSNNMNFHEKACYHKVKKIMQEIFYRKVINEDDYSIDNYIKEEQYQTKVIPLTKIKRK